MAEKSAMRGLDNAEIKFSGFRVPRSALLSRYAEVTSEAAYVQTLPRGVPRMLELLISRLLTGRICLSEASLGASQRLFEHW